MSDVWVALAETHSIELATPTAPGADLALTGPNLASTDYHLLTRDVLHPSRMPEHPQGTPARLLIVARAATTATQVAAARAGISLLVTGQDGPIQGVLFDRHQRALEVEAPLPGVRPVAPTPNTRGPVPWRTIALLTTLLNDANARTQAELADRAHLTQGRVSQALSHWDFVSRNDDGWHVTDLKDALTWLSRTYRAPKITSSWLSLESPVEATRRIAELLDDHNTRYAVTGQVAADFLAPWARPTRSTIWTDRLVDLTEAGCTAVPAQDATITLAVADDPFALDAAQNIDGLRIADPWRTWVTLMLNGDIPSADALVSKIGRH